MAKIFTQHPQAGLGASLGNMDLKGARPSTSGALLADQLRTFFDKVDIAKPRVQGWKCRALFGMSGLQAASKLAEGNCGELSIEEQNEEEAREDLVRYAQKLKSQLQRPAASGSQSQSHRELAATLPFIAHGDLSGFDQ